MKTVSETLVKMLDGVNDIISILLEVRGPGSLNVGTLISPDGVRHLP